MWYASIGINELLDTFINSSNKRNTHKMFDSLQVIRSLKRAMQPAVTDVSVKFKVPKEYDVLQCPQHLPPIFNGEKLVAYGILKSATDPKERVDCTAVLNGNVLGKLQEYEVPFTLEPSEAPSLVTAHHLAAKALITDWENEDKDKKSIVKLSVEASVISSHTAFIAVDEESSEPLPGAMKTYDITSHDVLLGCSLGLDSAAMSISATAHGSAMKKRKKGGFLPSFGFSARSKKSASKPQTSTTRMVLVQKKKIWCGLEVDRCDLEPVSSAASAKGSPISNVAGLITAQNINGSWTLDSSLAQQVGKSLPELESACPTECKGAVASVWATVLALCLLRSRYSSQQDEWELIAMKSESWLKKQSLPAKVTLDQLFQEAKKIM